ncbi:MAD-domain-containing protein [Piromyces finnis]|uniref:Spindle assembly checkpoint component MAD1 n=1 Tax=Piromyces finnis TaxID=1754191 RepID=A0A1Y1V148_9FUNG|nr:MAD-domain-containing protein [Piromyces finnis]|eukprot:ORX44885.1 MAD-domain-containing protein [Piromyces finnis]
MNEPNNNKKRKLDENQDKVNLNYHPFVRSTKKRDVLLVSPNNYLNNVKHLKQYEKEEEEKKENSSSTEKVSPKIPNSDEIENTPQSFYSPLLRNKKTMIIETEYELRKKIKDLEHQMEAQKLDYELKISELNNKYIEENMNLEHNIDILRIENIEYEKLTQDLDLEKQNLETTRRLLYEKELKSKETIEKLEEELKTLKNETKLEIYQTNNESISLKEALFNSQQHLQDNISVNELNDSINSNFKNYQNEINRIRKEFDKRTEQLNEKIKQLQEIEVKYKDTQLENKKLKQNASTEEMNIIKKELENQLKFIRKIEKKNKDLKKQNDYYKERNENIQILKEEIKTLENKAKAMTKLHEKISQLEIEKSKLLDEHIQWTSFLEENDTVGFNSPHDLAKALTEQRIEYALLKEKEGKFNVKFASQQEYINELENKVNELNSKYQKEYTNNQNNLKIISYKEKSKELTQRRILMLEEQLKSYDLEEMTMKNHDEETKMELERKNNRIKELQDMLNQYQNRIYELEKDVVERDENKTTMDFKDETISNYTNSLTSELLNADKEIQDLKKKNAMLLKENASLDKLVEKMEYSLGRGEYNPETTRVLQLAKNPELEDYSIRKATLDALRNENKALLKIIKKHNLNDNPSIDEVMNDNDDVAEEHIENIPIETYKRLEIENNKIEELEKKLDRLKTVFRQKSKEYREVVYSLLGYRFDFLQDGRVKLTSMYSQNGNQSFVFASSSNDSGSMELIGGGKSYIQSLEKRIDYFVGQYGSIPGLLASVTLDLFNQLKEQNKIESDNN